MNKLETAASPHDLAPGSPHEWPPAPPHDSTAGSPHVLPSVSRPVPRSDPTREPLPSPSGVKRPVPLKGSALRARKNRIENLRAAVQIVSLAVVVWIGVQFYLWVHALEQGRIAGSRPPGVEGFLPISALISLRYLFLTGQVSRVHPAGLVLFALIAANGLLLKRSFCSWICPAGTISESLATVGHRIFRRRLRLPRWLDIPMRGLKYLLLSLFVLAVFVQMPPHAVGRFLESPYNKVADIKMLYFFTHISTLALGVIGALALLSIVVPYFWCRYLCPYGALLAGASLASPVKVKRRPISCIDCGLCARACPSNLAVDRALRIDSDECTGCLSCVAACPVPDALQMELPGARRRVVRPAAYAVLVVLLFFGGIGAARLAGLWKTKITNQEFLRRVHEIHDPKYSHAGGEVPDYGPSD